MQKKKMKRLFSYLFTFFIAFFLFLIVLLSVAKYTVLSPGYFMKQMDKVNYYENTVTALNKMIQQNAAPAGLPTEMFSNYIKIEDIRTDMINYEKAIIAGKEAEVATSQLNKKLSSDIAKYATDKKIVVNETMQKGIDSFIQAIEEKYQYLTQFPYLNTYVSLCDLFTKIFWISMPILCIGIGVLIFFIYRMNQKWRRRRRYYAYGLIGAGLLSSILPMYLYLGRFIEKINLNPKYMYELMVSVMKSYLSFHMCVGISLIVLGTVVAYVTLKKKNNSNKKERVYPHNTILEGIEKI